MRLQKFLLYLLLLFLPVQLGRHFFFDFSYIAGVRSDYLAPTIYLTDLIILLMILVEVISGCKKLVIRIKNYELGIKNILQKIILPQNIYLFFVLCSMLYVNFFAASNPWVSWYKSVKIIEFILLGFIIVRLRPQIHKLLIPLSIAVIYSSLIAIGQFMLQRSIGGVLWFVGERSFYASTVGIAAIPVAGNLILRPYSVFPHPNVMGGFLAIILPILIYVLTDIRHQLSRVIKLIFLMALILGFFALIISFSKYSWLVFVVGLILSLKIRGKSVLEILRKKGKTYILLFYFLIILSIVVPVTLSNYSQSLYERASLIKGSLSIMTEKPIFGIGLNNFIILSQNYLDAFPGLFIYQPVHNIYLLTGAETGLTGLFLFYLFITFALHKSLTASTFVFIAFTQLLLIGLFDHYLVTLQQGQILFTVFASLAFFRQNSYTDSGK